MVLQPQRCITVFFVQRESDVFGGAEQRNMVEQENAVVDYRYVRRNHHAAISTEPWSGVYDVVCLPFSRLFAGICEWNVLLVYRACLAVYVGLVLIVVQNLDLVAFLQEYPAVAAALAYY